MTKEEERSANRARFPEAARAVDEFRSVFGKGVKLVWWQENGKTIGKIPDHVASGAD